MSYIKSERHFINYINAILREHRLKMNDNLKEYLINVYWASQQIEEALIYSVIDVITWELREYSNNKETIRTFFNVILPQIVDEMLEISKKNFNFNLKYLTLISEEIEMPENAPELKGNEK